MNRTDFQALLDRTFTEVRAINDSKGREYADDAEALANFYHRAEEYAVDPKVVCGIFLGKHVDAVKSFIRSGDVQSEPIESRVYDVILYSALLLGLVEDERAAAGPVSRGGLDDLGTHTMIVDGELREPDHDSDQLTLPTLDEVRDAAPRLPVEEDAHRATQTVVDTQALPAVRPEDLDHGPVWTDEDFRQRAAEDGVPVPSPSPRARLWNDPPSLPPTLVAPAVEPAPKDAA